MTDATHAPIEAPGNRWSTFGAIIFVSALGPALVLLLTTGVFTVMALVAGVLDFGFCRIAGLCASLGAGNWFTLILNDYHLAFVLWVTLATGFACFATLELAFHVFQRAAPMPVLVWHVTLIFILAIWLPFETPKWMLSSGWAGTALVSMHYLFGFKALRLYQPPEVAAGEAQYSSAATLNIPSSAKFSAGMCPRQRAAALWLIAYEGAIFLLALHYYTQGSMTVFVTCLFVSLYCALMSLHGVIMAFIRARPLVIDHAGLVYLDERLSWREIGRLWTGSGRHRHVVAIETSPAAAKRMLGATTWINRLFAMVSVAPRIAKVTTHCVFIDTRFLIAEPRELLRAIEARRQVWHRSPDQPEQSEQPDRQP